MKNPGPSRSSGGRGSCRRGEGLDVQDLLRQFDDELTQRQRVMDHAVLVPAPLAVGRPAVLLAGTIARQRECHRESSASSKFLMENFPKLLAHFVNLRRLQLGVQ